MLADSVIIFGVQNLQDVAKPNIARDKSAGEKPPCWEEKLEIERYATAKPFKNIKIAFSK